MLEESASPAVDTLQERLSSEKEDENSTNSEPATDIEHQEISDDDDDDRNHKHRKREAKLQSLDDNVDEESLERPNRKRNRQSEKGQFSSGNDFHGEGQRGYWPKFNRRPGMIPTNRGPSDSGPRSRVNQSSRHVLPSSATRPPMSRGRGRNNAPWNHDPRFNPLDMIDFASQMASQGPPTHPGMYMGTGLPNGASPQDGSWGPYGFVPGMGNGILDPIHPLGLQGALQPGLSPLIDLGMLRQRCIDFEERGFCLRGDMCPMEHGVNRIVVDDMQSLSQFNLSVTNALGVQNETATAPPVSGSSSLVGSKTAGTKDTKSVLTNDAMKLNAIADPATAEAEVYDPDQPLWSNERAKTSGLRFLSSNNDGERLGNADLLAHEGSVGAYSNNGFADDIGQQNTKSVWGRINSRRKSGAGKTVRNQRSERYEESAPVTIQGKPAEGSDQTSSKMLGDVGRYNNRNSQKASRTLYVNGIPLESNRWETLLSHFQKFGQVIDIYIPTNSEKAFVQFSKREEAEAALKAPDAVMGNRFIKLWWANRDRIPDEGESRVFSKTPQLPNMAASYVPSQPSPSNRGKENAQSTSTKVSAVSFVEASSPTTAPPKSVVANVITAIPSAPKKPESLELLEGLRKKQEALAQKRDEFRRQLEKLTRQASLKKGDAAEKGGDVANGTVKETGPKAVNQNREGTQAQVGDAIEKKNSGDLPSPTTRDDPSATTQKSAMALRQTTPASSPLPNSSKLDNHTTSFRVLPPIPAEIADVTVLKDHFSSFGELSSVVLEDTEAHYLEGNLKPSLSCSACVTYTTRQSAKNAFFGGKSCKGHTLSYMWLTASPGSNGCSGPQATPVPVNASGSEIQVEKVTSELSLTGGKLVSGYTSGTAADGVSESLLKVESRNAAPITRPEAPVLASSCSSSSVSSNVDFPPARDVTEDVMHNADAQ